MNKLAIVIFIFLIGTFAYVFFPDPADNAIARVDLIYSIVYHHALNIDAYYENSADVAFHGGHYYYSNGPGAALPGAALLAGYRALTGDNNPDPYNSPPLRLITLFLVSLPAALLGAMLFLYFGRFAGSAPDRAAVALAFSLGTLALPYSALYYTYLPGMFLCFSGFLIIERYKNEERFAGAALFFAGFLVSYAVVCSYDAALTALPLAVYCLLTLKNKSRFVYFMLGALPPAAALAVYNHACFGSALTAGIFNMSNPDWKIAPQKFFADRMAPGATGFWRVIFAPGRGLLWLSPFIVFSAPGFFAMLKRKEDRAAAWLCLATSFLYLAYNAAAYWAGGYSPGPRYLTPGMIFLCIPIFFWLRRASGLGRALFAVAAVVAIAQFGVMTLADPHVPDSIRSPFFAFSLPMFLNGYTTWTAGRLFGMRGPESLLPYAAFCAVMALAAARVAGKPENKTPDENGGRRAQLWAWPLAVLIGAGFLYASYMLSDVKSPDAAATRAAVYYENRLYEPAARDYSFAIERAGGRDATLYFDRALAYSQLGENAKAGEDFRRAAEIARKTLERDPNNSQAKQMLEALK